MGLGHLCGHQPPWDPSWCHALHQQGHSIVGLDETFGAHQVFPKGHTNQEKCSITFLASGSGPKPLPPHNSPGKDSDAGRDWGQEEKGTPEDEMAGWHH